jgi:hypothetical protein
MDDEAYKMETWKILSSNLTTHEKLFLIAKITCVGNPALENIAKLARVDLNEAQQIEHDLVAKGWLEYTK